MRRAIVIAGLAAAALPAPSDKDLGIVWLDSAAAHVQFTKTEVTVAQYRACVEAKACKVDVLHDETINGDLVFVPNPYCNYGKEGRDDHPLNCAGRTAGLDFCRWVGGRLPTEAEWEAEATNGGTRLWPWGDVDPSCSRAIMMEGNWGTRSCGRGSETWPVCSRPQGNSISGLCDMIGNVWEMTALVLDDGFGPYVPVKGGDGKFPPDLMDPRSRFKIGGRDFGLDSLGFRCVRDFPRKP